MERVSAEALNEPNENLFMPLTPGVQIVGLATTPRRLLEALRLIVRSEGEGELLVAQFRYHIAWHGLWYLNQDPDTWPNPLTIQAIIKDDKGDMDELVRVQIQQTHAEKVRLAVRGNPRLMKLAPLASHVNFVVQNWLDGWKTELPVSPSERAEYRMDIPAAPHANMADETSALQDLVRHLEQKLDRGEAKREMALTEDGLKSRLKRLRKLWNMPNGSTWDDYIAAAEVRRGV